MWLGKPERGGFNKEEPNAGIGADAQNVRQYIESESDISVRKILGQDNQLVSITRWLRVKIPLAWLHLAKVSKELRIEVLKFLVAVFLHCDMRTLSCSVC